jgi:1,2-diacylglycerol 3-beta-glucosyltransferase
LSVSSVSSCWERSAGRDAEGRVRTAAVNAVEVVLVACAVPFAIFSAHLFLLTLCSARRRAESALPPRLFFDLVVPAHDEAPYIGRAVSALRDLDYPAELFRVLVVADNCTDATATNAESAGATVLVRNESALRGKGYALELAFARFLEGPADAVVVVDADAVPSANLLGAFSARLERGAGALQSDYRVLNPDASWRTRLMRIALGASATLRSLGRERLGLSAGLRGTGMCFAKKTLRAVPFTAHSVVEDLEYTIQLARAGIRVHFVDEAQVRSEMTTSSSAARVQRRRWEGGRRRLRWRDGPSLIAAAVSARSALLVDLALELLTPPLAQLVVFVACGAAASLALCSGRICAPLLAWGFCVLALVAYTLRGWALSGSGVRGLLDLGTAPLYIAWKAGLLARGNGSPQDWIRTPREQKQ